MWYVSFFITDAYSYPDKSTFLETVDFDDVQAEINTSTAARKEILNILFYFDDAENIGEVIGLYCHVLPCPEVGGENIKL